MLNDVRIFPEPVVEYHKIRAEGGDACNVMLEDDRESKLMGIIKRNLKDVELCRDLIELLKSEENIRDMKNIVGDAHFKDEVCEAEDALPVHFRSDLESKKEEVKKIKTMKYNPFKK
jgi:hypothetical protein